MNTSPQNWMEEEQTVRRKLLWDEVEAVEHVKETQHRQDPHIVEAVH